VEAPRGRLSQHLPHRALGANSRWLGTVRRRQDQLRTGAHLWRGHGVRGTARVEGTVLEHPSG